MRQTRRARVPSRGEAVQPARRAGRASALRHATDVLVASDPGLTRWRSGERAILTAAISTAGLVPLARWRREPAGLVVAGIVVATMAAARIYDRSASEQRVTLVLAIPVTLITVAIGSIAASRPWLDQLVFCGVVFAGTFARRYGPRGSVLGLLAFMCYFFSLFGHGGANDLALTSMSIVGGVSIAYAVLFGLVRDAPDRMLDDLLVAFRARAAALLDSLAAVASSRRVSRWRGHRIRVSLARLNDVALALEDEAESRRRGRAAADRWAFDVFEVELAVETVADVVGALDRQQVPVRDRGRLAGDVAALGIAIRADAAGERVVASDPRAPGGETDGRMAFAAGVIRQRHPWSAPDPADAVVGEAIAAAGGAPLGPNPDAAASRRAALEPALRLAVQAALAAALAMLAGHPVSSARWYWAVVGAFVVFMRSTNRDESVSRAWQRILGTVGGVALGVLAASVAGGSHASMLALLLCCVFGAFYMSGLSYAWMMLFFTTALALLYDALGTYSSSLLAVRLEETLIGAGIGAIVASVLLPAPARSSVHVRAADVLRASDRAVAALTAPNAHSLSARARLRWARSVDRAVQRFRLATRPGWEINAPLHAPRYMESVPPAIDLAYAVRHLVARGGAGGEQIAAAPPAHWLTRIAEARASLAAVAAPAIPLAGEPRPADIS